MATTDILQFAGDPGANVVSQATYAGLTGLLLDGFSAGTAASDQLNKVWRQSSFMAAGLANFIVNRNISVPDDGDLAALIAEIEAALNARLSKDVSGGVDVTLNPVTEANYPYLYLHGVLTANINVIVPNTPGQWTVHNDTSGAYTLALKTVAGSGITIPQGAIIVLFCDGTNVYGANSINGFQTGDVKGQAYAATQQGWLPCDGSSQLIASYPQLSALIRGTFGGVDGTHFYLPDYRGRTLIGDGTGATLTARTVGQTMGEETHVLTIPEMPAHTHASPISAGTGFTDVSSGTAFANGGNTGSTGGDGAHNNMQPSAVVHWVIKT